MDDPVLQTVALGTPPWPTMDPFLFCVHHVDLYPQGNEHLGPDASLAGREIGMDFAGVDGWRMYHGQVVPGFPQHPHRGFETVTIVRRGLIDHADSLGAAARFGRGDVQWLTAGAGIVHSEMFPLLDREGPNPAELFQLWLNLPRRHKLAPPHFTMLWAHDIPTLVVREADGPAVTVTVVAGALGEHVPPAPPPDSWAGDPGADVAIWLVRLDAGATWTLPAAVGERTGRTLYVFDGEGLDVAGHAVDAPTGVVLDATREVPISARGSGAVECLLLQGRPIGEPVAQYGPFVMNDRAGVQQAFDDYQRTRFGGWPWPVDDPVHGDATVGRFARHADGRVEQLDEH
jgi:redox-sensitive bicupin YhaK (pirin superfamily)